MPKLKFILIGILKGDLASKSIIYLVINGINAIVPFLMLPILTYYLSPDEYGQWGLFLAIASFISPLIMLGFDSAIGRKYFDFSKEEFSQYIGTTLIINTTSLVFISLVIISFTKLITNNINLPLWWIYSIPFFIFVTIIDAKVRTFALVSHRPIFYSFCLLGNRFIQNILIIISLVIFTKGVGSILVSYLVSLSIVASLGITHLYKIGYIKFNFSKDYARHALNYGIPLIPYTLGLTFIDLSDRFFIEKILGTKEVGIYTVGCQISAAFMLVISSTLMSWCPWVLKRMKNITTLQDKLLIVRATYILLGGIIILSILLAIILPFIVDIFLSSKYQDVKITIPWLVVATGCFGIYQILCIFLIHAEKTKTIAKFVLMAFGLDFVLNYLLIKENGLIGAAQARICAYIFMFICASIWTVRNTNLPWRVSNIFH